jgi:hypothetical protein
MSPEDICTDFAPLSRKEQRAIRQQAFEEARYNLGVDLIEILEDLDIPLGRLSLFGILLLFFLVVKILLADNPVPWAWMLLGLLV